MWSDEIISVAGLGLVGFASLGVWLLVSAAMLYRTRGYRQEIDYIVGSGIAFIILGMFLALDMVRRQIVIQGEPAWWFSNSLSYFLAGLLGIAAILFMVRSITRRIYGEWPWLAALVVVIVGMLWSKPAEILGRLLYALIELGR